MTAGILPRRFNEQTKWSDIGATRMQAWLDTTKQNDADIRLLRDLVNRLMQRRTEAETVVAAGFQTRWATVDDPTGWSVQGDGDTLMATMVGGEENTVEVAKYYEVRVTPFFTNVNPPIVNGYKYRYDGPARLTRTSREIDPADPFGLPLSEEPQAIRPEYFDGQRILMARGLTGGTGVERAEGEPAVLWQELTYRTFAQVFPDE